MGSDADVTKPSPYLEASVFLDLVGVGSDCGAATGVGCMAGAGASVEIGRSHVVSPVVWLA